MRDKLLWLFGTLAILASAFAADDRKPPPGDAAPTLSNTDKQALLDKLNQDPPRIDPSDILKLMAIKLEGGLSEDLKTNFAEALLAATFGLDTLKIAIKTSLDKGEAPTPGQQQWVAWAMSKIDGELTNKQKETLDTLRLSSRPKVGLVVLSAADLAALLTKLTNKEALTTDEVKKLIVNSDDFEDDVQEALLAEYILKDVTEAQKTALLDKLKKATEVLTEEDRNLLWAMDERNMVPEGTVPTREEIEAGAMDIVKNLTEPVKTALKEKLAAGTAPTGDDLMKLKAMEKVGELDKTQRDLLATMLAKTISDDMFQQLTEAIETGKFTENDLELIQALVKAGKIEPAVFEKLKKKNGFMSNNERIADALAGNADFPPDLDANQIQLAREMGRLFKGLMEFEDIENTDVLKKLTEKFGQLTEAQKNMLKDLKAAASSISKADIEGIDPKLLEMFPAYGGRSTKIALETGPSFPMQSSCYDRRKTIANMLDEFADALDEGGKKALCRQGIDGDPELYEKIADRCDGLISTLSGDMEKGSRRSLAENFIRSKNNPSQIEGSDLETLIGAKAIFKGVMDRVESDEFLRNEGLVKVAVENGEGDEVMKKIREAKGGNLSSLTVDEMKKIRKVRLSPSDVDEISADTLKGASPEILSELDEDDFEMKAQVAKKIRDTLTGKIGDASPEELFALLMADDLGDDDLGAVSDVKVEEMLTKVKTNKLKDKSQQRDFAVRVTKIPKYSVAETMTTEKVEEIAEILNDVLNDFFDKMPDASLLGAVKSGSLKTVNLGNNKGRRIGKLFIEDNGSPTPGDIKDNIGSGVLSAMDPSDLDRIPDATVADTGVLDRILEDIDEMPAPSRQVLVKKIKAKIRVDVPVCSLGAICRSLSLGDVEAWPNTVIDEIKAAGGSCKLDCDRGQLAVLAKKMLNLYGEPGSGNSKYDTDTWNALYILVPGLPLDVILKIHVDRKFPSLVKKVQRDNKMLENKLQALIDMLEEYYTTTKPTTTEEIAGMGPALRDYSEEALNRDIPAGLCADAVKELIDLIKTTMPLSRIQEQAKYALDCLTGATSGAIISDVAKALGDLLCYIPTNRVSDLTDAAARDVSSTIQNCPLKDTAARQPYKDKLMEAAGITTGALSSLTEELIGTILFVLVDLSRDERGQIPRAVASKALDTAVTNHVKREKEMADREETLGEGADVVGFKTKGDSMTKDLFDARVAEDGGAARRKRSTGTIQCSAIQSAGQMARSLTIPELTSLTDPVILECKTTLGSVLEWSSTQKQNLAARLKTATIHGTDLSQWTSAQIQDSGTMVEGLSTMDLGKLPWTTNLLGVHGSRTTWTPEQLAAVAAKWVQSDKGNNVASITADNLNVIGHFICGLTVAQINAIPLSVYQGAIVKVGEAQSCSADKAQAFATKAKEALGQVNTWTPANVISVNNVLAGITGTELSSLSSSHLMELRPATIAILPPNTLSGLTSTQLRGLSKAQVLKVTEEQYEAFNPSQQEAVVAAGGYKYTTDKDGAAVNKMPVISGILVIMVTLFLM